MADARKRLPTLRQLRHFVAVADCGHFGHATEACLVTQSSLSASIKELETGLGQVLIERTRRSVMLTPLGREVLARARKILRDTEDLVDLVAASRGPLHGPLRLGVIPTIGPFLLPRVLPALRRAYPDLRLYLREERTAPLIERLNGGDLDLLLMAFPYPAEGLESHVFADDGFWVAFAKGHGLAAKERVTYADLAGQELLLLEEGHCLRTHALSACRRLGQADAAGFHGTSLHTLVQMVDNGLGLTLLPKMAVDAGITKGARVQVRPLEGRAAARRIGLAWRPSSPRKEEFLRLGEFFRDELATPLPPARGNRVRKKEPCGRG